MADEVYKILQSRLRRNAQHVNCGDQPDCDACRKARNSTGTPEDPNAHARKKARVVPPGGEVNNKYCKVRVRDKSKLKVENLEYGTRES